MDLERFVAGKLMKRNGQLLRVDWNAVRKTVNESREYVIKKSGFRLPRSDLPAYPDSALTGTAMYTVPVSQ